MFARKDTATVDSAAETRRASSAAGNEGSSFDLLTTDRAARQLGISTSRLRFLIRQGRIEAERLGRDWFITPAALAAFERRPEGWQKGRARK